MPNDNEAASRKSAAMVGSSFGFLSNKCGSDDDDDDDIDDDDDDDEETHLVNLPFYQ